MFISSGLDFEHVTNNTDLSTLDEQSKYRSPHIYSILSELQSVDSDNDTNSDFSAVDTDDVYNIGLGYWSVGCDIVGVSKANRSLVNFVTVHVIHPTLTKNHVFPVCFWSNKGDI